MLAYPGFDTVGFPTLATAWTVEPATGGCVRRDYDPAGNPPVLHRKELLVATDHPGYGEFAALTRAAEVVGLMRELFRCGCVRQWECRLQ